MKFSTLRGNSLKLDGGAMFGNAPKALWSQWTEADEMNRIDIASRCLLVETGGRRVLFETGAGCHMPPALRKRFGIAEPSHELLASLGRLGLAHTDITDIVLSHLHFDHVGGLLSAYGEDSETSLLFPGARYHVGTLAWERAVNPGVRDRASFLPVLNELLEASGRLVLHSGEERLRIGEMELRFITGAGHTPGMLSSDLRWEGGRLVVAADLIPGQFWLHLPITMGYDRFPERLVEEKAAVLFSVLRDDAWLFYTHDSRIALSKVTQPRKGRYEAAGALENLERSALS